MEYCAIEAAFKFTLQSTRAVAHEVPDVCWCGTTATSNYVDQTIQSKSL